WVTERRCPLVLKDRALELDLPGAAACAEWAATEPERPVYPDLRIVSHPYPAHHSDTIYWCRSSNPRCANEVPPQFLPKGDDPAESGDGRTDLDAILWLLDNWKIPA